MNKDAIYEMILMDLQEHNISAYLIREPTKDAPTKSIKINLKQMQVNNEIEIYIYTIDLIIKESQIWGQSGKREYKNELIADLSDPQCFSKIRM